MEVQGDILPWRSNLPKIFVRNWILALSPSMLMISTVVFVSWILIDRLIMSCQVQPSAGQAPWTSWRALLQGSPDVFLSLVSGNFPSETGEWNSSSWVPEPGPGELNPWWLLIFLTTYGKRCTICGRKHGTSGNYSCYAHLQVRLFWGSVSMAHLPSQSWSSMEPMGPGHTSWWLRCLQQLCQCATISHSIVFLNQGMLPIF